MNLLLIGPFPEPVGGVSTHLVRLAAGLKRRNHQVSRMDESSIRKEGIFNVRSSNLPAYFKCLRRADVVHIHSSVHLLRFFHILCCRLLRLKTVVTIHSWRAGRPITLLTRWLLNRVDEVILVNEDINRALQLKRYHVLPAFLPPHEQSPLSSALQKFINHARTEGRHLLSANAYELLLNDGKDLYGLDLCIMLADELINKRRLPVSFMFVVSSDASQNPLYHNALEKIRELNLTAHFCLHNGPVDFITIISQSNVVLRPTNTDGDALTVREALHFHTPIIASDAARRPPGTVLFKNRDVDSLVAKTLAVLQGSHSSESTAEETDLIAPYLNLYHQLNGTSRVPAPKHLGFSRRRSKRSM